MDCFHCNQHITTPVEDDINGEVQAFCCSGCATVCKIITSHNLDSFYQQKNTTINPVFTNQYPLEYYDLQAFRDEFIESNKITLISPSIHCAACVWLIEKTLSEMPEVKHARVHLSNYRIFLELKEGAQLSPVMEKLTLLGYASEPALEDNLEIAKNKQHKILLAKIGFAGFAMMNLMWISISLYSGADNGEYGEYFLWLSFALATPTLFYSGSHILRSSWNGLKHKTLNMDTPISIGALATYCYSSLVLFGFTKGEVYFDTVVNFIFIILIGRYLEASVKKSAINDSNSFASITPKFAAKITAGVETLVAIASLKKGDTIVVKTGERIGVDGEIVSGSLSIDESIITGESLPVEKEVGDSVFAGTLSNNGSATIAVKNTKHSMINHIKQMVERASANKPHIECVIDKFIPYFVIATISIAIFSFFFNLSSDFDFALLAAVSVLIITCPCAFGIAVPITNAIAGVQLLKNKIIVKNNDILENIERVDTVVFDKTGTLTTGEFSIQNIETTISEDDFMQIVASISAHSNHPLSKSVVRQYSGNILQVENFVEHKGMGLSAILKGDSYNVGSADFMNIEQDDKQNIYCSKNGEIIGSIYLQDRINTGAKELVEFLCEQGKKVVILSGDNKQAVEEVVLHLGVDEYYFTQKPQDKVSFIEKLQKNSQVLMVGDGVNDAPALALASCSIAISGIDVASDNADCLILKNKIIHIKKLWKVATTSRKIILQNIIFALSYNAIFVPLAFFGLITPLFAAIVMPISSIVVILNAIRLKYTSYDR